MYGKEKTGLRRLWECDKAVFAAAVVALIASLGQLDAAYLFYLPGFADMKPFIFLMYTVILWLLLSMPAYLLSAYLEDHYATEENGRFFITAFIAAGLVAVLLAMNWKVYFPGFLAPSMDALSYSVAMTLLLLLPLVCGLCQLRNWHPLPAWITAGLCAAAMTVLAILSLIHANIPNLIMALSYVAMCVAYALALPKILTYVPPVEEEEDDTPTEKAIMKDEF